jgi:hypothetical protein
MTRTAATASFDYRLSPTTTLGAGAGVGIGGAMTLGAQRFHVLPGWEVSASFSRRLLDGRRRLPFLVVSAALAASGASTREEVFAVPAGVTRASPATSSLYAIDLRAGLTVGKTFFDVLSPYAVLRAFGGPVLWSYAGQRVTAGDRYHVQLGAGLLTALPRGFDIFVEGVPLGERALTLGLGRAF